MASKCKCKCKIISLGTINKKFLLIIIHVIACLISMLIKKKTRFFSEKNDHPIVYCIIYSLGLCFSFIFLVIYKLYNKKKEQANKTDIEQNYLISLLVPNQTKVISIIEKFLFISLVAGIDYLSLAISSFFLIYGGNYINSWPVIIISMTLFSYLFLKVKLYSHHYLSMSIIIILGLLYNVLLEVFTKENMEKNYIYFIAFFCSEILNSLVYFLYKYYMHIKYIISFEILFYQGLIELSFGIITLIITTSINKVDNFIAFCKDLDVKEGLLIAALILTNFISSIFMITIINIFSPFHIFLSNALTDFLSFFSVIYISKGLNNKGEKIDAYVIILCILFFIIGLFMILIYIEIIQLDFCGLSNMTIKNIQLRAQLDCLENIEKNEDDKYGIDTKGDEYTIELTEDNFYRAISFDSNSPNNINE